MGKNNTEIERKFFVSRLPENIESYEKHIIRQGYISTNPTMRLRMQDNNFIFTFKGAGTIEKLEFEYELNAEQFTRLWQKVESNTIEKTRYIIPLGNGLKAELDIYGGFLDGFMNVEVEFESVESANAFVPPKWFGADITEDRRFSNASLSINGLPKDCKK